MSSQRSPFISVTEALEELDPNNYNNWIEEIMVLNQQQLFEQKLKLPENVVHIRDYNRSQTAA